MLWPQKGAAGPGTQEASGLSSTRPFGGSTTLVSFWVPLVLEVPTFASFCCGSWHFQRTCQFIFFPSQTATDLADTGSPLLREIPLMAAGIVSQVSGQVLISL